MLTAIIADNLKIQWISVVTPQWYHSLLEATLYFTYTSLTMISFFLIFYTTNNQVILDYYNFNSYSGFVSQRNINTVEEETTAQIDVTTGHRSDQISSKCRIRHLFPSLVLSHTRCSLLLRHNSHKGVFFEMYKILSI